MARRLQVSCSHAGGVKRVVAAAGAASGRLHPPPSPSTAVVASSGERLHPVAKRGRRCPHAREETSRPCDASRAPGRQLIRWRRDDGGGMAVQP